MLKVSKNSRQIPKNVEICGNKKYYDILYAYLQYIAVRCDDKWYVDKSEINFSKLGRKFDLTRQTVATKFKNLKELGLIEEIEGEEKYLLTPMNKNFAALIPYETLKLLTDTLSHNTISTYIYLLNRAHANEY